jgi:predicted metal-dependent HD superfamily phosphohydrolase
MVHFDPTSPTAATSIVFDDCLAILQERAKLYAEYRADIRHRIALMREACPEQVGFEIAARAFVEAIGEKIPDRAIKVTRQKARDH